MSIARIWLLVVLLVCGSGAAAMGEESAEAGKAIRALIPKAAAMSKEDFLKLAEATTPPGESDFKNKSLTLMLLNLKIQPDADEQAEEEFRFLTETPKPSELTREIYRTIGAGKLQVLVAPVTMIQANRITKVTCDVEGDRATGSVSFEVPRLYAGRVAYVAVRKEKKWRIEQLMMPSRDVHILRAEDGTWKRKRPASGAGR